MQRHPVDLFLPTRPIPKGHRIGEGTIVEVIAVFHIRLMTFLLLHCRQDLRQFGLHAIPRKMNSGIIFQIPVQPGRDTHIIITPDHDLVTFLVEFEKIDRRFHLFNHKFTRRTFIDTFQQPFDRGSRFYGKHNQQHAEDMDDFHLTEILFIKILTPYFPSGDTHHCVSPFAQRIAKRLSYCKRAEPSGIHRPRRYIPFARPSGICKSVEIVCRSGVQELSPVSYGCQSFTFASVKATWQTLPDSSIKTR